MFRPVLIALCVFCMGARPYEDTKKRFKISLPDEWTLAPAFGDTFGMTFERKLPKKSERLTLVVHVDPTDATGLDNFADQIATSLENNGHRSTGRGFGKVGDREAVFRDFDKDGQQQSRSYFFQDQGYFFHVRFASPSNT